MRDMQDWIGEGNRGKNLASALLLERDAELIRISRCGGDGDRALLTDFPS
jgi:hypothetical protein